MTDTIAAPSADTSVSSTTSLNTGVNSLLPQSALDAADAKIASWSVAIIDAADTIERLVSSESIPVPDTMRDFATSATRKLRGFGSAAGEKQAVELVNSLQRSAAAHPIASIGLGAAIGAALATLLVRLSPDTAEPAKLAKAPTKRGGA